MILLLELILLALVALAGAVGAHAAVDNTLAAAAIRGVLGDAGTVRALGVVSANWFVGAVAVVAGARAIVSRRRGRHIASPLLVPAALAAAGLGLVVQLSYGNPYRAAWPGPAFAQGVFVAALVAAAITLFPWDPAELLRRGRVPLAGGVVALFFALVLFGTAPGTSDQRINLGPIQPIEAIKIGAALFLAIELGRRAGKLRFHRTRAGPLRLPRLTLLIPALATLVATIGGLFFLKDLGPTLIMAGLFLALYFIVTRSPGWVLLALAVTVAMVLVFAWRPEWTLSTTVETRLRMWTDPWYNGLPNGDQLARARWTLAAGGATGAGVGATFPGALPAGHTDLVYAQLVEALGVAGGAAYLLLLGIVVGAGLHVAARNRTPERVLIAAAMALLIGLQAAVILSGTLGIVPLTGVVVPFLSYGKSGMAAFLGAVALILRLAEDGALRAETDELRELRLGVREAGFGFAALALVFLTVTGVQAVVARDTTSLRSVVTTLADGTPALEHDPRLQAIADAIRRGSILDRLGQPLAVSPVPGTRIDPLGAAFGTVLGPADGSLLRAKWSLERIHEPRLRGYGDLADGPAIWLGMIRGKERVVLAVASAANPQPDEAAEARHQLERRGGTGTPRRIALVAPDFTALLPLSRLPLTTRGPAVAALSEDVASRSVTLTLDARLQAALATAARAAARKSKVGAAAVVVLDPVTGHTLARAQWPDYDPGSDDWRSLRIAAEPTFMGVYGAWSDKTGAHGVWQAGSVFKVLSALVAVRSGIVTPTPAADAACPPAAQPDIVCNTVVDGRTAYTRPEWSKPIHDFGDGGAKGTLDLITAITRSSNVYFGQLALMMGPEPYRKLRQDGVEFGNPGLLDETDAEFTGIGAMGSRRLAQTGFGQGAGSWNVTQAARVVAAVANGGVYRRCGSEMTADTPCAELALLVPGAPVDVVLAGMRGVMVSGTGRALPAVPGVRLYGKTGTADAPGTQDEAPWGIKRGQTTTPHSWFVAIAEPEANPVCTTAGAGRYVVAAVVPHGGFGSQAAGPLAIEAVRALQTNGYLPPP